MGRRRVGLGFGGDDQYLADAQVAKARALVKEAGQWADTVNLRPEVMENVHLRWADYLFNQGDYATAQTVYEDILGTDGISADASEWTEYRIATCVFEQENYQEAATMFAAFANKYKNSIWKKPAELQIKIAELEQRRRGMNTQ